MKLKIFISKYGLNAIDKDLLFDFIVAEDVDTSQYQQTLSNYLDEPLYIRTALYLLYKDNPCFLCWEDEFDSKIHSHRAIKIHTNKGIKSYIPQEYIDRYLENISEGFYDEKIN